MFYLFFFKFVLLVFLKILIGYKLIKKKKEKEKLFKILKYWKLF